MTSPLSRLTRLTTFISNLGRRSWRGAAIGGAILLIAIGLWLRLGPLPAGLLDDELRPSTILVDRHGEQLYEARSALGLRGTWLEPQQVPELLSHATLAAEDVRFYWHPGVDPVAITRAAWRNLRAGRIEEGGSTITQQVAKLLLARQADGVVAQGWMAKLREAIVAVRLEHRLSKTEILTLYVNLAPYGNQIQGLGRAAHAYLGRSLETLTVAEAAFLAALPQQPGRFNPWRDAARGRSRQAYVLSVMADRGWIDASAHDAARTERLTLTREDAALLAPHFVERVLDDVRDHRPRRVQTTLDATLQRTIHGILSAQRELLNSHRAANVSIGVLDNRTGEWLAWEGSGNYFDAEHGGAIDGLISPRQPGSALKPFTYAAAFEHGMDPGRVLPDVPSQFPTADPAVSYSPRNYDGRFRGPMLMRQALAGSENVPAVALASEIGVPTIARLLRRAGLTSLDQNAAHYGLGLTLGNAEIRLDELISAYAMLARGGELQTTRRVISADGTNATPPSTERVLSERTAFWITDILSDPEARAYAFGRGGSLEFPFPVAAKTGTSQAYFDNWVVGYTRDVTVGVWVGNFDRTPLRGSSGITGAGPIFHAVMLAAVERMRGSLPIDETTPIRDAPMDLERRELCALSGMAAGASCPTRASEWLVRGQAHDACTWHHSSDRGLVTIWPEVYQDWTRQQGIAVSPALASVPPVLAASAASPDAPPRATTTATTVLSIVRPVTGAVFMIDPTLRPEFQMLSLSAQGGDGRLFWFVDEEPIATAESDRVVRWPLARGRHEIKVRDTNGQTARTRIEVR